MRKTILVVEDEPQMLLGLRDNLELEGYDVATATDGKEGLAKALSLLPDLMILDVSLPHMNGFDVCRELRRSGQELPVIMLTARAQEAEKILGLELGADDYMTKPFSIKELIARIRAVLRRLEQKSSGPDRCQIGDLVIDFRKYQAYRGTRKVDFTTREFDLLRYFVAHTGVLVTREQILNEVWGFDEAMVTRTIDNFVVKLRQKVEPSSRAPEHILTVHGAGYKFVG